MKAYVNKILPFYLVFRFCYHRQDIINGDSLRLFATFIHKRLQKAFKRSWAPAQPLKFSLYRLLLFLCLGKQALKNDKECQQCGNGDFRPPGRKGSLEGDERLYGSLNQDTEQASENISHPSG